MKYGYARVSTDGQSVNAQVAALRKHGAAKVFREVASGAKTNRAQLRRVIDQLDPGDVLMVTRLDRLARSTRDLLNTLAAIADRKAGVKMGRPPKLTPHQQQEAIKRRDQGEETLADIGRSYNVSTATISKLADDRRLTSEHDVGRGSGRRSL
jgi:DNA invertase Pin-like site-specific DNA recombinase